MFGRMSLFVLFGGLVITGCGNPFAHDTAADLRTAPPSGACHNLSASDLRNPSDPSTPVSCTAPHTTQTFTVGTLPASTGSSYDDRRHGSYVYTACQKDFQDYLGAEESMVLRSQLSWAWFRPSAKGWDRGARWYRCDIVGGSTGAQALRPLPANAQGLFGGVPPDAWMTCARGSIFIGSTKVPCSEKHDWRAVTTVKIGLPTDPYPGDRIAEVRSRDYCQESVGGWAHYPPDFDFGYSWFHEAEWAAGNRRSVCWARTTR